MSVHAEERSRGHDPRHGDLRPGQPAGIDPTALLTPSTPYTATLTGGAAGIRDLANRPSGFNQLAVHHKRRADRDLQGSGSELDRDAPDSQHHSYLQ
ncbi:hypothetical protein QFZ23_002312 [Arthrobacter globiformis]|uniref:Ig-like domain-containing protein n=1 Tax=Arthrobacter globiformis TaxID=1665 RepID=UPI00277F6A6E|nr:Ig-like domain-containing protein [Arthrobacter globiformis]MDQ1058411.1 hypothetical protein [Arthrobacter globiformis]